MNIAEKNGGDVALIGVEAAQRAVDQFVAGYSDKDLKLLLLSGPPGAGKTTLAERALKAHDYTVYRSSSEESTARETAQILKFCRAAHSVDTLLARGARRRRAVFVDDCLPDAKSISTVYNAIKSARCAVLLVACIGRSVKAPEVRRRAALIVAVPYPSCRATTGHLSRLFDHELSKEAAKRCAVAAGGCVPKAVQLARGELYGTTAVESARGVDTTIFDDVARGMSMVAAGRGFKDVEVAISSEPSMSAMILRESLVAPSARTRESYRMLSKIAPGSWLGPTLSAVVFMDACLREREALERATLKFPRCYTTTSSRTSNAKKRMAADAQSVAPKSTTDTCAAGRRS